MAAEWRMKRERGDTTSRRRGLCTVYGVLPMRTMRGMKWRKELEYPEPRSVVGFYSKNPCTSSMVSPFERLIQNERG